MLLSVPLTDVPPYHPLLLLLAALALEPLVGEARGPLARLPHPVRLLGWLIGALDRKLNRESRSAADRRLRGVLVVVVVCGLGAGAGWVIEELARLVPLFSIAEFALVVALLAQRSLFLHVRQVADALHEKGLEAGRAQVAHIVGRDVRQLDEHGVARAAIESCAENFSDGVVAPAFWYVVFGLPGMLAYKAVNTLDSMVGYRSPRYLAFGWAAARLDDLANLAPARLSGCFVGLAAAAVPGADPRRALRIMWQDCAKHRSPNAGWPEAAMAGALGLSLAGPRRYPGLVADDPWIGEGTTKATAHDVGRALAVFAVACLINWMTVAALALTTVA